MTQYLMTHDCYDPKRELVFENGKIYAEDDFDEDLLRQYKDAKLVVDAPKAQTTAVPLKLDSEGKVVPPDRKVKASEAQAKAKKDQAAKKAADKKAADAENAKAEAEAKKQAVADDDKAAKQAAKDQKAADKQAAKDQKAADKQAEKDAKAADKQAAQEAKEAEKAAEAGAASADADDKFFDDPEDPKNKENGE